MIYDTHRIILLNMMTKLSANEHLQRSRALAENLIRLRSCGVAFVSRPGEVSKPVRWHPLCAIKIAAKLQ